MSFVNNLYKNCAFVVFNSLILFIIINLFSLGILTYIEKQNRKNHLTPQEYMETNPEEYSNYFPDLKLSEISKLHETPGRSGHPVLEYMERPTKSRFYTVGMENIRYDTFVNQHNIDAHLLNESYWVLGGSTVFGHGVPPDATISYFLSKSDTSNTYINFGVQGYHLNLEIEKLILLLKKGYVPKGVIFLDGLNDAEAISKGLFDEMETPSVAENGYYQPGRSFKVGLKQVIDRIPFVELYNHIVDSYSVYPENKSSRDIYAVNSKYYRFPKEHFLSGINNEQTGDIIQYYSKNINFVSKLSEAYGFEFYMFLQPNGFLLKDNPYIVDSENWMQRDRYLIHRLYYDQLKLTISKGGLPMNDLSDLHTVDSYIDIFHYSPDFNQVLANEILSTIQQQKLTNP